MPSRLGYIESVTKPKPPHPLPRLTADPDAQLVRWGWIAWSAVTVFLAVRYFVSSRGAYAVLTSVQLVALWLLWPLYRGGRALWHWTLDARYAAWNGSYYEFDGLQMRVLFADDDVFIVAADVFDALHLRGHAIEPQRVRAAAGRDGLRKLDGRREIVFTERGLAAWLERRTDEKSVAFQRWVELQVLAPHRRRRDRLA